MYRQYLITLIALLMLVPAARADDIRAPGQKPVTQDAAGFGIGAVVGGVLGGPVGAIAGAAGGAGLGAREEAGAAERAKLTSELADRNAELERLRGKLLALQSRDEAALQPVRIEERRQRLQPLARAVAVAVYFRTDSSELEAGADARLLRIADQLREHPRLRIHVAGHADRRGSAEYNLRLSRERAESVAALLHEAGIDADRIHIEAHGNSAARAPDGDLEGYMFDRRVSIELSLTDPV